LSDYSDNLTAEVLDVLGLQTSDGPGNVFTDWATLKAAGYDTTTNFKFEHLLVPRKGEKCEAMFREERIMSVEEWRIEKRALDAKLAAAKSDSNRLERIQRYRRSFDVGPPINGKVKIIRNRISLFHWSQMVPGNFRGRTRAIIRFGNLFWKPSNRGSYIERNLEPDKFEAKWFTRDSQQREFYLDPFVPLSATMINDHLNQRAIFGVKPDAAKPQFWVSIDLDLHGGDPGIFLRQVKAMLRFLDGKRWIVCVSRDQVAGIHLMKIWDQPQPLLAIRSEAKNILAELALSHPQLDLDAAAAGMKGFGQLEVFPDLSRGFRLPLGIGYTALVDHPLGLICYHTYRGQKLWGADVESFVDWDGTEMLVDEKIDFIRSRLLVPEDRKPVFANPSVKSKEPGMQRSASAPNPHTGETLGPLKGRYRQTLVEFFSGRMQRPKSLQVGILAGANALWAQGYPLEDRADYLLSLLRDFEVEPGFSSRMSAGAWDRIRLDCTHVVNQVERLRKDPTNERDHKSNGDLRKWAKAMAYLGFEFGNRSTWDRRADFKRYSFILTAKEIGLINQELVPALNCELDTALQLLPVVVRIVAVKAKSGQGISREYRRAILVDHGISCQENSTLAKCWRLFEEMGFIECVELGTFLPNGVGLGKANRYRVGSRLWDRIYPGKAITLPAWLSEQMIDAGEKQDWIVDRQNEADAG
jgi:hypothetical protein